MIDVKKIIVKVIPKNIGIDFIKKWHYSNNFVRNSSIYFGAFYDNKLVGAVSLGPSLHKKNMLGIVKNTGWNDFIEINRLAMIENMPKNSESRFISVCCRLLRKNAPHIKFIISFADASHCGDGAIYRASGFLLTGIKKSTMWALPDSLARLHGHPYCHTMTLGNRLGVLSKYIQNNNMGKVSPLKDIVKKFGGHEVDGFQLRYIYFINKVKQKDLMVPILPFSKIDELNAGMYKGEKITYKERNNASEA